MPVSCTLSHYVVSAARISCDSVSKTTLVYDLQERGPEGSKEELSFTVGGTVCSWPSIMSVAADTELGHDSMLSNGLPLACVGLPSAELQPVETKTGATPLTLQLPCKVSIFHSRRSAYRHYHTVSP